MDFLNQATAQIRDLFRSMTPGSKIASGLLLVVVVISLFYLVRHQVSGPDAYLMGGEPFSASQLPAMEAAFAKAGLTDYEVEANRIRIPRGQHAAYMGALADGGALPPNFGSYLEKALATDSPFMNSRDKAERLKAARQNELSLILRTMQGIESASVIYDVQPGKGLNPRATATASVNVKPAGSVPLDRARVAMIRNLVAAAVAGLKRENVTVTDLNGRTYPGGGGDDALGVPEEDPYFARKQMYENQLKRQIEAQLSLIPGVLVQVSAELDRELKHVEKSRTHDPKTVPLKTRAETSTKKSQNTLPGGRPGLAGQGAAQGPAGGAAAVNTVASSRSTNTEEEDTIEETQNVVGTDEKMIELKGLTPKRVKVTIAVPSKYYEQVWHTRNKPAEGEEPTTPEPRDLQPIEIEVKKNIENTVVPLLPPVPAGEDIYPLVAVNTFQSLPGAPIVEPSMSENAVAWVGQYWSTLGMTGLAFFSLMMLRSMIKSVPGPNAGEAAAGPTLSLMTTEASTEPAENESTEQRVRRRIRRGPNLKDDLAEMVREDPEAAATIVRNWIQNAS